MDSGIHLLHISTTSIGRKGQYITPESIHLFELSDILNYMIIKDILPPYMLLKYITNFTSFINLFITPFVRISEDDD